jgi:cytidylate kinase
MDFPFRLLFDGCHKIWEFVRMNQADVVRRYLQNPRDVDFRDTGFPFITISRQAGTEAHAIGRFILMRLAEYEDPDLKTGWDLFDQKLCALIAQNKSLDADYDTLVNEKYRTDGIQRMVYEMLIGTPQQYKIQKKIEEVIRLLARLGKVVVIGRAGFLITRDMPGAIHIRIIASMEHRAKTVMKQDGLSEDQAVKKIHEIDAERAAFLKSHHNFDIHDLSRFDIVWNLDRVRVPDLVAAMAELVRLRLRHLREIGAIQER